MKHAALELLDSGISVIPLGYKTKKPAISWEPYQKRLPTPEEIEAWFEKPHNIGVVTGAVSGGLLLVDIDKPGNPWPPKERITDFMGVPCVETGGGGRQYWFHSDVPIPNSASKLAPHVDIRGEGGYGIAPPSIHPSGNAYKWIEPFHGELPELPQWIKARLLTSEVPSSAAAGDGTANLLEGVSEGERNDATARLAGRYFAMGMTLAEVIGMLILWNQKNDPPLPDEELRKVIESIGRREGLKRGEEIEGSNDHRADILQALGDKFDVHLQNIRRIGGDNPYYEFVINDCLVPVEASKMVSQHLWRKEVVKAAEKLPKGISSKARPGWEHFANQMMGIAEHVEPGEEATLSGQLMQWLEAYLQSHQPYPDGQVPGHRNPVYKDSALWMHAPRLRSYIVVEFGHRLEGRSLTQLLASLGFTRKTIAVQPEHGDRRTVSMYRVPFIIAERLGFKPPE